MPVASASPRWDLTPFFSGVQSSGFKDASTSLDRRLQEAEAYWDRESITSGGMGSPSVLAAAIDCLNDLHDRARLISNYLECLTTTDSTDEAAAASLSAFDSLAVRLQKLQIRFALWVGGLDL